MSFFGDLRLLLREPSEIKRFLAPENESFRSLVFYSEHKAYSKFFNPILDELVRAGCSFSFLTSDAADPIFDKSSEHVKPFYVKGLLGGLLPQMQTAKLVMTMPDLHQFHLKRSESVREHIYFFHALVSTHMIYRKGSFDHYDTILCCGPHHVEEIRRTEQVYGLKPKKLVEAGYPLLDQLREDFKIYQKTKAGASVEAPLALIAPSWAPQNILLSCLEPLVKSLAEAGFRILIRPHPEFVKRFPKEIRKYQMRKDVMGQARWEMIPRAENSLFEADVLVTDWSGIAFEYAFATERPALYMDTPRKVFNPEYQKLELEPLEVSVRPRLGRVLPTSEAYGAGKAAAGLFAEKNTFQSAIREERDRCLFNNGSSARFYADFLRESLV